MDWGQLLDVIHLDQIAYAGVVLVIIFAILTDRLVPRSRLEDMRLEKNEWKAAYMESEKANRILMEQASDLIDGAKTTVRVVDSLPSVGGGSS